MKIYTQEKQLEEVITKNNSIACSAKIEPVVQDNLEYLKRIMSSARKPSEVKVDSDTLFPYISLFVTSNWNANDDVFTKEELYKARKTPVDHPCNINHIQEDIVGHITDIWMVDQNFNILDDSIAVENLPDMIHLVSANVLYTVWKDEARQNQINDLMVEMLAGNKSVSMECVFYDFDYALIDSTNGSRFTVARDEETAFLTKHLRIYGGSGEYSKYKIGRQIKDLAFIGKGIVDDPANPYSVIFNTEKIPAFVSSSKIQLGDLLKEVDVTGVVDGEQNLESEKDIMSQTCNCHEQITQLEQAKADLASQVDTATAKVVDVEKARNELNTKLGEITAEKDMLVQKNQELEAKVQELTQTIADKHGEFVRYVRSNELKALQLSDAENEELITNFGAADDKTWAYVLKLASKKNAESKQNTVVAGVQVTEATDKNLVLTPTQADTQNVDDQLVSAFKKALAKNKSKEV